ncbi:MAG TPA: hypothetical protein VFG06_00695 [Thermodesulfovibrionales bacterium]|nr:hypothetical protein [Thermodesulfovibrionales bacterium]
MPYSLYDALIKLSMKFHGFFAAHSVPMVVIIRLDRIIHLFSLDCPIKSGNDDFKKSQIVI